MLTTQDKKYITDSIKTNNEDLLKEIIELFDATNNRIDQVNEKLSQRIDKQNSILAGEYIKKNITIIRLTEKMEDLVWEIFRKQTSKNVSFVDCATFALYQQGVFDKAFTFDSDFKKNKIPILE